MLQWCLCHMLVCLTTPHSDLKKMPRKPLKLSLNTDMGFRCPPIKAWGSCMHWRQDLALCNLKSGRRRQREIQQCFCSLKSGRPKEKDSTLLLQSEVRQAKRERDSSMLLPANKRDVTAHMPHLWCKDMMACLAVSGESEADPGAFLTGANSEARATSISETR